MTDKAYIVANEQQEMAVLRQLEQKEHTWTVKGRPTTWLPSQDIDIKFPYALVEHPYERDISWVYMSELEDDYEIAFDGRKEEKMSDKYVVSQEFMDRLEYWKQLRMNEDCFVGDEDVFSLPILIQAWWGDDVPDKESNNRLIAIIRWVNGEDVFEVEKPKKWVVRSKDVVSGLYYYVHLFDNKLTNFELKINNATKFDTKEEAESWANSHQEVIQMEDE